MRSRATTTKVEEPADLEGFFALGDDERRTVKKAIDAFNEDYAKKLKEKGAKKGKKATAKKPTAALRATEGGGAAEAATSGAAGQARLSFRGGTMGVRAASTSNTKNKDNEKGKDKIKRSKGLGEAGDVAELREGRITVAAAVLGGDDDDDDDDDGGGGSRSEQLDKDDRAQGIDMVVATAGAKGAKSKRAPTGDGGPLARALDASAAAADDGTDDHTKAVYVSRGDGGEDDRFANFCDLCDRIGSTPGYNDKTSLVKTYITKGNSGMTVSLCCLERWGGGGGEGLRRGCSCKGSGKGQDKAVRSRKEMSVNLFCIQTFRLAYSPATTIICMRGCFLVSGKGFKGDLYLVTRLLLPRNPKRVYNMKDKTFVRVFSSILGVNSAAMTADLDKGDCAETCATFFASNKCVKLCVCV